MKRSAARERGFSLMEVLVAMVILTVGATSLIAVFAAAAATHKRSVDHTHAAVVAEEVLAEVQARYIPGVDLDELEASLLAELPETINGYDWDVVLHRPGDEDQGPKTGARAKHTGPGKGGTGKKTSVWKKTTVPRKTSTRKAAAHEEPRWSSEELVARVVVGWSQSGRRLTETFDTILLPR